MTEIKNLLIERDGLQAENEFLQRQVNALKIRCSQLSQKNIELECELSDLKFSKENLIETEINEFIAQGEAHYEKFAFIGDDF